MIREIFQSLGSYIKALELSFRYGWWKYYLLPGLLAFIIAICVLLTAWWWGDNMGIWLWNFLPEGKFHDWGLNASQWVGRILIAGLGIVLLKYILLVLLAPFLSLLSEKVELRIRAKPVEVPFTARRMFSDAVRGLRISVRNIIRELCYVLILMIAGLLGPVALISTVLIFLIQSYYAGFGNLDFALERHFGVQGSVAFVRAHKGIAIGNGIVYMIMLTTIIGLFFAPALSTIAGTIDVSRVLDLDDESDG